MASQVNAHLHPSSPEEGAVPTQDGERGGQWDGAGASKTPFLAGGCEGGANTAPSAATWKHGNSEHVGQ